MIKPLVPGAFPSLCCSLLGWVAMAVLAFLGKATPSESPDGTGAVLLVLISVPLILAAVALWLTGLIRGWLALRKINQANGQFRGRFQARTALALGGLPFAILSVGALFLLIAAGTGKDIRDFF